MGLQVSKPVSDHDMVIPAKEKDSLQDSKFITHQDLVPFNRYVLFAGTYVALVSMEPGSLP